MSLALLRRSAIRPQHSAWLGSIITGRHVHETNTPELIAQRTHRPLSPHLTIYQLQLTSLMSIGHRITGTGLATLIYGFGLYYAMIGPSAVTEQLAMAVASAPTAMVVSGKFILSLPFFFHTLNGVRHLVWDTGSALSLRGTYVGGWIVNSASIVLASFFSFFY